MRRLESDKHTQGQVTILALFFICILAIVPLKGAFSQQPVPTQNSGASFSLLGDLLISATSGGSSITNCLGQTNQSLCQATGDTITFSWTPNVGTFTCTVDFDTSHGPANKPFDCVSALTIESGSSGAHILNVFGSGLTGAFQWVTVGGGTPVTPSGAESAPVGLSDNVNPPVTSSYTGKEDAPFRDCLGYATVLKQPTEQPITKVTPGKAAEITAFDPLVIYHFPSSATYTIEGRTSLVNVAKNVGGNGEFTIQIFKDLENNQDNQIGLENGAPSL